MTLREALQKTTAIHYPAEGRPVDKMVADALQRELAPQARVVADPGAGNWKYDGGILSLSPMRMPVRPDEHRLPADWDWMFFQVDPSGAGTLMTSWLIYCTRSTATWKGSGSMRTWSGSSGANCELPRFGGPRVGPSRERSPSSAGGLTGRAMCANVRGWAVPTWPSTDSPPCLPRSRIRPGKSIRCSTGTQGSVQELRERAALGCQLGFLDGRYAHRCLQMGGRFGGGKRPDDRQ